MLVDIYEGKKSKLFFSLDFKKYKALIRKCFRKLDYQPDQDKVEMIEEIFG